MTTARNINKALKAQRKADLDIWESQYMCGGHRMRQDGKRMHNRAQRRLDKAVVQEQQSD